MATSNPAPHGEARCAQKKEQAAQFKLITETLMKEGCIQLLSNGKTEAQSLLAEYEDAIRLIAKAWCTSDDVEKAAGTLQEQAELVLATADDETAKAVLDEDALKNTLDAKQRVELIMGMFYAACGLERHRERLALFNMASHMAEILGCGIQANPPQKN